MILRAVAGAVLLLGIATPAAAHEGMSGLQVNVSVANPGAIVEVRGDDVGSSETVDLVLVGRAGSAALARIAVGSDGHFTELVQVPADAPVGIYEVRAIVGDRVLGSAPIGVDGQPMAPAGGGADPDFQEGVSAVGGPVGAPVPTIPPLKPELPDPVVEPPDLGIAAAVVLVAIVAAVGVGALARRRSRAA